MVRTRARQSAYRRARTCIRVAVGSVVVLFLLGAGSALAPPTVNRPPVSYDGDVAIRFPGREARATCRTGAGSTGGTFAAVRRRTGRGSRRAGTPFACKRATAPAAAAASRGRRSSSRLQRRRSRSARSRSRSPTAAARCGQRAKGGGGGRAGVLGGAPRAR